MARERARAGPASVFGLEDEPFAAGYAALAPATTDADGAAQPPARRCRRPAPVSRPLTLTATLRVRDGSGRPVERSVTRPLLPAAPLIGLRPLFDGAVDEGGTAGFEAIALGPDLAPADLAGRRAGRSRASTPTSSGTRPTASGTTSRSPGAAASPTARSTSRPARRRGSTCRSTGAATSSPSPPPTAATSRRASASTPAGARPAPARRRRTSSRSRLDREAYAPGDTARARIVAPNPGHAPRRRDGRPADRDPHPRRRGRRDRRRRCPSPRPGAPAPTSPRR